MVNTSVIIEYIKKQANNLVKYDLIEFFKLMHTNYFSNIDISFMEYFLELCNKQDEFCINQEKLKEYGVLTNIDSSTFIKKCLKDRLKLEENEHYRVCQVTQPVKQGGFVKSNKYTLNPIGFKIALIRSQNTKKYAMYYLLLEKVFYLYQEYQKLYQEKIISIKDSKIDNLQKDIKEVLNQNNKQSEQLNKQNNIINNQHESIEKLMKYAKDTNDIVHELNIKVDELLKLIHKFLSNQINLLYTFNSNIDQTKVLIIYKLQNLNDESKYQIVIRYCGLNMISNSINQFTKKKMNTDYKIVKSIIIGAIQENMITIQNIYKNLDSIENINKQTIKDISNDESETIINDIFKIVNNNKLNLFVNKLEDNKVLKSHCDTMKHLTTMDNEFNNSINNLINDYLGEKLYNNKSFRVKKLCGDLKVIYDKYKN